MSLSVPDSSPFALLISCYLNKIKTKCQWQLYCLHRAFWFQHTFTFFRLVRFTGPELFSSFYRYGIKGFSDSTKVIDGKANNWIKTCFTLTLCGSFSHHWKLDYDPGLISPYGIKRFQMSFWKITTFTFNGKKRSRVELSLGKKMSGGICLWWFRGEISVFRSCFTSWE